jgi:hypothetical protein
VCDVDGDGRNSRKTVIVPVGAPLFQNTRVERAVSGAEHRAPVRGEQGGDPITIRADFARAGVLNSSQGGVLARGEAREAVGEGPVLLARTSKGRPSVASRSLSARSSESWAKSSCMKSL